MKYFVETSAIINFLKNKENAVSFIESLEGELTSSFVCLAELYEGIYRVNNPKELEKGVLLFFTGLGEVYGLDQDIAKNFGQIRAELKKKGEVIEDIDILIAATCVAQNLTLITYNPKHFQRVSGLKVITPE
ncbi:MAG: type II toxin-antitoxin system VapC family toxin [Patescibacteria group bacterium]